MSNVVKGPWVARPDEPKGLEQLREIERQEAGRWFSFLADPRRVSPYLQPGERRRVLRRARLRRKQAVLPY